MARPPRIWSEGCTYHLFSRGSDRRPLFDEPRDYAHFVSIFSHYATQFEVGCFAWALMPNHWHLLARTSSRGLSQFVKRLNHRFSLRTNRQKGRTAHLFQNRFGSVLQEDFDQFIWTVRYVLRNPVEAGVSGTVEGWPWTSYHATTYPDAAPSYLLVDELLACFGGGRETQLARFKAHVGD